MTTRKERRKKTQDRANELTRVLLEEFTRIVETAPGGESFTRDAREAAKAVDRKAAAMIAQYPQDKILIGRAHRKSVTTVRKALDRIDSRATPLEDLDD